MPHTPGQPPSFSARFQPVLGTELHVLVGASSAAVADRAQARVLDEILRLEALLSTYREDTPLVRWMRGDLDDLPAEVVAVLTLGQAWFVASAGLLNPGLGGLRRRWVEAEREGRLPGRAECRDLAARARTLPFVVDPPAGEQVGRVHRLGNCSVLDLDALAKGWVVDRAAEAGAGPGVDWLMVNVGGDLRLVGPGSVRVAVEDPATSVDNAEPLTVVPMTAGGLASSGGARRGFRVEGRWWGHVLDPRTGWPVERVTGATVVAPDAATADALATVVGVAGADDPVTRALLEQHDAAALVAGENGAWASDRWREAYGEPSVSG